MFDETIDSTQNIVLGEASDRNVSRYQVSLRRSTWTGSVTPKGRTAGSSQDFAEIGWFNQRTMADVAAGSAPTDAADMLIDASGLDVRLDVVVSTGSVDISARPLDG